MNSIPIYVLRRAFTDGGRRRAARGRHVKVVGVTAPAAGLESLRETVLARTLHYCEVCIPVVSIGYDSMGKLCPEFMQLCLEHKVVAVGLVVDALDTSDAVSVVFRRQRH